jgi:hypothetical protein
MKITNIKLMIADKAIDALIALKIPFNAITAYKLAQISIALRSQASTLEMTRNQLIAKYNPNGNLSENSPEFALFFKEWKTIADLEVEIDDVEKVNLKEFDDVNAKVTVDIMRDLSFFIEK